TPVAFGHVHERTGLADAGIVEDHVQPAEGLDGRRDQRFRAGAVRYIHFRGDRRLADVLGDLPGGIEIKVRYTYAGAVLRQIARDLRADSASSTGDNDR